MARFGASRSGGARRHAGDDVYAKLASPVRAIEAGTVTGVSSTYYRASKSRPYVGAVTVQNEDGSLWRYCEVLTPVPVKVGQTLRAGDIVGHVGNLYLASVPDMLHLERFSGSGSGPLTVSGAASLLHSSGKPYVRRKDLLDPTELLDDLWAARKRAEARPVVKRGDKGASVFDLMTALHRAGDYRPVPDQTFGDATDTALKAWQARHGLTADGVCGAATWEMLAAHCLL